MMDFFAQLSPNLQMFWYVAIFSSIVFIIQSILTFVGMDGSEAGGDFATETSGADAPFQLFTFRNLINFLLGFGWTGVAFYAKIDNKAWLIFIAVLVGVAFVLMFFGILKSISNLAENNSFSYQKLLHQTGEVYLPIPANLAGKGKVLISVNGAFHELDAISTDVEAIPKGKIVRVSRIEGNNLLVVQSI